MSGTIPTLGKCVRVFISSTIDEPSQEGLAANEVGDLRLIPFFFKRALYLIIYVIEFILTLQYYCYNCTCRSLLLPGYPMRFSYQ